jgi:hypothetical protein
MSFFLSFLGNGWDQAEPRREAGEGKKGERAPF